MRLNSTYIELFKKTLEYHKYGERNCTECPCSFEYNPLHLGCCVFIEEVIGESLRKIGIGEDEHNCSDRLKAIKYTLENYRKPAKI